MTEMPYEDLVTLEMLTEDAVSLRSLGWEWSTKYNTQRHISCSSGSYSSGVKEQTRGFGVTQQANFPAALKQVCSLCSASLVGIKNCPN